MNWNPCPETYRFHATAIGKQALPERTSRVSTSNSFAIHPPVELHDEGCLGRAGSSLIHMSFSVRAVFCMAKLEIMEELLVAFIKIVFHNIRLHRIPFFAVITQWLRERGTFTTSRNDCGVPRRLRTLELEEAIDKMCATKLLVVTSNRTCSGSEC